MQQSTFEPQPVFDQEPLTKLLALCRQSQGLDAVRQIITLFVDTSPEVFDRIRASFEAGQLEDLSRGFHRLKGSASHIGGARLEKVCEWLERKYAAIEKMPERRELEDDLATAEREFSSLRAELRHFSDTIDEPDHCPGA